MLSENISNVLKRISHAAMQAGRSPDEVRLVAVTKTVSIEKIQEAVDAGLRIFGENRVQEALPKIEHFRSHENIRWHMIGTLQKNKARKAVENFDIIESVDSLELTEKIDASAGEIGKLQDIFVEVKLGDEPTKHGVFPQSVEELVSRIGGMKHVRLCGLMTVPPYGDTPEDVRPYFRKLREMRDGLLAKGYEVKGLSMGMSHDFEVAVEEGATEVRIGTEIFGRRA